MMRLSIILAAVLLLTSAMAVNAAYIAGPAIAFDEVLEPTQSAYYVQPDQTVTFTAYAIDIDYWGDPTNYYDAPLHLTWTGTDIAVGPVHSTLYEVYREGELLPLQKCELQKSWATEGTKTIHLKVDDHPHYANDVNSLEMDFVDVIVDGTDPNFTSIIANPDNAEEDDSVTITFTASETLGADPTVTVNGHSATYYSKTGLDYTYTYTVLSTDPAGPATIVITANDLAANQGSITNKQALCIKRALSYSYDSSGNLTVANTNRTSCVYTYDERYRLREVRNRYSDNDPIEGALVDYTVDGVGNRTEIWFDDDYQYKLTTYGYDAINRLTLIDTVTTFSYDWVGNRSTTGGQEVYDDADKLTSDAGHDYQYLPTGSLEEVDEDYLYEYDPRGLLSTVTEQ